MHCDSTNTECNRYPETGQQCYVAVQPRMVKCNSYRMDEPVWTDTPHHRCSWLEPLKMPGYPAVPRRQVHATLFKQCSASSIRGDRLMQAFTKVVHNAAHNVASLRERETCCGWMLCILCVYAWYAQSCTCFYCGARADGYEQPTSGEVCLYSQQMLR